MTIPEEWLSVCEELGYEKTIKLINNGTTISVAEQIIQAIKFKNELLKLE